MGISSAEQSLRAVQLRATSTEDEKSVNDKKLKLAFFCDLKIKLAQEQFAAWSLSQDLDKDTEQFAIQCGDSKSIQVQFEVDGLHVVANADTNDAFDVMLMTFSCYKTAHDKCHPNAFLEFELTCNDEKEAEKVIERAMKQGIDITSLSFHNYSSKDAKPTSQNKLLEKIKARFTMAKNGLKNRVSSRPT